MVKQHLVTDGFKEEVGVKNDTWKNDHDNHRNKKWRSRLLIICSQLNKRAAK